MTTLQHNIKRIFEASGLSQRDFADKYGVSGKVLWTYIHGTAKPNGQFVLRLCEDLSIDFAFINNTRIRINGHGEITNRPDYRIRAARIRKDIEQLLDARVRIDKDIRKLLVDLESVAILRRK